MPVHLYRAAVMSAHVAVTNKRRKLVVKWTCIWQNLVVILLMPVDIFICFRISTIPHTNARDMT